MTNEEIHKLYPEFRHWVKEVMGYMSYPSESDIRLWEKFKEVSDDSQRPDNSIQNK